MLSTGPTRIEKWCNHHSDAKHCTHTLRKYGEEHHTDAKHVADTVMEKKRTGAKQTANTSRDAILMLNTCRRHIQ